MAKKAKVEYRAQAVHRPDGTLRGIRVLSDEGREFLRADGIPAARRAMAEGTVQDWVPIALAEADRVCL